jgi:ABC-type sugar transport system ATPase subunit
MATIRLDRVTKSFGKLTAVNALSFEVGDGEFFCILGPPGAGKTTTLRTIIGLETPEEGSVYVDGERVNEVHPSRRDIAMIFQNLALYPDKTVFENIASPLRRMKIGETDVASRVREVAKQLRIDWLLEKTPGQLSGGERQRVAIGRAIVRKPKAYLMDEPLSNLDALLRLEMRVSLKELQARLKQTFIYVTHDQVEALSMADRMALLDRGVLQQIGAPDEVYRFPANTFAAKMLGNPSMNFLDCRVEDGETTIRVLHDAFSLEAEKSALGEAFTAISGKAKSFTLGIRPEDIGIGFEKPEGRSIGARIYVTEPLGNKTIVDLRVGRDIVKAVADASFKGTPEIDVWLTVRESKLHLFDLETGVCVYHAERAAPLRLV